MTFVVLLHLTDQMDDTQQITHSSEYFMFQVHSHHPGLP